MIKFTIFEMFKKGNKVTMNLNDETKQILRQENPNKEENLHKNASLNETAVRLFQISTGFAFSVEELQRLYIKTPIASYFIKDNINQCDTGSAHKTENKVLKKVNTKHHKL